MDDYRTGPAHVSFPTALTDEELLSEYRSTGSEKLFAELVKRYERELYNYLRRYLGDAVLAEDAFQATFLQVHLKCDQYEPGRPVRPWLYTIATHQAIDAQRRNRRHKIVSLDRAVSKDDDLGKLIDLMESREQGPVTLLEGEEREAWIRRAVDELPDPLRTAVVLVYYRGLKYREAADELNIPVGTVKSRLHSAILKLNEAWTSSHPHEQ